MNWHKFILLSVICISAILSAAEKKVLTIGNSFTWSLRNDLPAIAKAQGDTLKLAFANHGGCTIQRHWGYVEEEEAKPEVKKYTLNKKKVKLREILAAEKWDIVTIQQASPRSWIKGSFYPELDKLVAYVKKHAPGAKILFQQTWSYRYDSSRYKEWKKTPAEMYQGIYENYKEASAKFGFGVIPSGLAVEIATAEQPVKFTAVPAKQIKQYKHNQVPEQPGSLHTGWRWMKHKKNGKLSLRNDTAHLNERGRYLQSCVWYGYIFGKSPLEIKYNGQKLDKKDAEFLRRCADKALKTYK